MTRKRPDLADHLLGHGSEADIPAEAMALEDALLALHGEDGVLPNEESWDRIALRIDRDSAAPGTATVAPDEGVWEMLAPGIERKVVGIDSGEGLQSYFIRMSAGAVFPSHAHHADEHCVILEGRLEIGGHTHGPGTYHLARKGVAHVPITAETDALFFIRGAI